MDTNDIKKLIDSAHQAMVYSYCPYSRFPVGSALLCFDGSIFTGCNVENSAFSSSICAERTAIVKAVSNGKRQFKAIAVTSNLSNDFCSPCGNCRQVMAEFGSDLIIILANQHGEHKTFTLRDLLPHSFGPQNLLDYNESIMKIREKKHS